MSASRVMTEAIKKVSLGLVGSETWNITEKST